MTETRPLVAIQDGDKIRELRKDRLKISGSEFARRLGILPQSLFNIENGHRSASLGMLVQIATALDEPIDSFIRKDAA